MEEIWKPIPKHDTYSISSFGRVRNEKTNKIYAGKPNKQGYLRLCLSENGKRFILFIHRAIALAFIPNVDNKPMINHKDGNKTNNSIDNLEWCTAGENTRHAFDVLGIQIKNKRKVKCIETNEMFDSVLSAAKEIGVSDSALWKAVKLNKKCKGFTYVILDKEHNKE